VVALLGLILVVKPLFHDELEVVQCEFGVFDIDIHFAFFDDFLSEKCDQPILPELGYFLIDDT
jgi:hypothetical protein